VNARKPQLRMKLMVIAVLPLAALTLATLWTVNRTITDQVQRSVRDDLRRASAVFEGMLESRWRTLEIETQTIVQDPKFFSILTVPGPAEDPQLRATVAGVARDFNLITESDLFEVLNDQGQVLASVGRTVFTTVAQDALTREALQGRAASGLVIEGGIHYQASASPVLAGGRVIGALVLGSRIGDDVANQLQSFTRSEVTFLLGNRPTVSTLENQADLAALSKELPRLQAPEGPPGAGIAEIHAPRDVYLTLLRPIPLAEAGSGHSYVMQRSLDDETAFLRSIQAGLVLLGAFALIAALIAGWVIADRIVAPVNQIVLGAEAMERGDYEYPLVVRREDEIGYLAERFREMRQQQRLHMERLQEADRAKSEFISLASHELRTPISVIQGFQELMRDEVVGPLTPQQRLGIEAIGRSTESLLKIAEDASRMAQIRSDRFVLALEPGDVTSMIERAVDSAQKSAPDRRLEFSVKIAGPIPTLVFDRARLGQAITHLLTNAIRFTADGGRVDVESGWDGRVLEIAVRDTGIGIPAERRTALLESGAPVHEVLNHHSSTTLEFKSAGLGLGLPIARGIVEAHGGLLSIESEVGRGSTFVMRLPLVRAEALEKAA
jgi:signal transduction histidine kinase